MLEAVNSRLSDFYERSVIRIFTCCAGKKAGQYRLRRQNVNSDSIDSSDSSCATDITTGSLDRVKDQSNYFYSNNDIEDSDFDEIICAPVSVYPVKKWINAWKSWFGFIITFVPDYNYIRKLVIARGLVFEKSQFNSPNDYQTICISNHLDISSIMTLQSLSLTIQLTQEINKLENFKPHTSNTCTISHSNSLPCYYFSLWQF